MSHNFDPHSMHRSRKPKPLFGLFRKNKPEPVLVPSSSNSVPLQSIVFNDPRLPKGNPLLSPQLPPPAATTTSRHTIQTRPRSKSVGRDPSAHSRLMEERESALNKLCSREMTSPTSSLAESLPLLSPSSHHYYSPNALHAPPPVPPIPKCHQSPTTTTTSNMRKFSSAHDLRKAAKLQQECVIQAQTQPLPPPQMRDLARSRSFNGGQRSQRQPLSPVFMRPRWPRYQAEEEDDDDVPLGYLQSPISRPSSLLSDAEEEDDQDLVPIAILNTAAAAGTMKTDTFAIENDYQTAADKYKEKVKQKLQFDETDSEDDDDIPISLLSIHKNVFLSK
ncbi:uncharacterized protein EV154DRAFT_495009 [Mucor mucedo]|uniref:uncharacterized protein n=1 Tax=Mucor mucedo TaxID=29922 RepID=UPI0022200094|nr:uncharacterized protein EV154DRAFT_495009 [Mucor mucedo]KAI7895465.1 hypothetical protein EV154DRAFT_495009 [Mucor mucedo]